jgi:uncharacterized surface anchored protein
VNKHLNEGAAYRSLVTMYANDSTHVETWKDISNLFSRSTFVVVADQKQTGTLTVSNTVKNAFKTNENNETTDTTAFTYDLTLKDANGKELSSKISYSIYQTGGTSVISTGTTDENGKATFQLSNDQYAVFTNIPADTAYTVTETTQTAYNLESVTRDVNHATLVDANHKKTTDPNTAVAGIITPNTAEVNGTLYWYLSESDGSFEKNSTVDYVNTYIPSIVVYKESTPSRVALSDATFTLVKVNDETGADVNVDYGSQTTGADGKATFTNIENGTYRLTETVAPAGYNKLADSITVVVEGSKVISAKMGDKTFTVSVDKTNGLSTITVPNSTGYKLPSTGGIGREIYTYCALVVLTGVALGGCVMRKRVRRR